MSKKIYKTPDNWGNETWLTYNPEIEAKKMREIGDDFSGCSAADCIEGRTVCGVARFEESLHGSNNKYLGEIRSYYRDDTDNEATLIAEQRHYR